MATPALASQRKILDWKSGPIEVLPLLPAIRDCSLDIEPPQDHKFVLRVGDAYFRKFHSVLRGPAVGDLDHAKRLDNLILVASFAVFVVQDTPELKDQLFVELVKTETRKGQPCNQSRGF